MGMTNFLISRTIAALRLPLAVMVVFIHSFGQPAEHPINWAELGSVDVYNIIRVFGSHVVSQIAVPTFFLISGYLFFIKMQKADWSFYKAQWTKRIRTLLVPYLIWNLLAVLYIVPLKLMGILINGKPWSGLMEYLSDNMTLAIFWNINSWGGGRITLLQQVTEPRFGPASVPLWFLRDLMVAVLLAPLLCWLIRKTKGMVLLLLAVIYVLRIQTFLYDMTITALFFFGIGAWFALNKRSFVELAVKQMFWMLPLWVLLLAVGVYYDGPHTDMGLVFHPWMVIVGVFAFIAIVAKWGVGARIYNNKSVAYAAGNTFFIYVAHGLFGLRIVWLLLGRLPIPLVLQYLLAPFMAIVLCLTVLWLMRRFLPRVTAVMIGER